MRYAAGAIYDKIKELNLDRKRQILVFAGSGNNGGDGYEIAASFMSDGYDDVTVVRVVPQKEGIDANLARRHYLDNNGREIGFENVSEAASYVSDGAVIVDAVLGIGITSCGDSPNALKIRDAVRLVNSLRAEKRLLVLSVDIPSLLNADNGMPVGGEAVMADYTYTVFTAKTGTLTGRAMEYCGTVRVVGNTLPDFEDNLMRIRDGGVLRHFVSYGDILPLLPKRNNCAHKGTAGRVLLVGGSKGMTGALILASLAALRSGAGLITSLALSGDMTAFNAANPCIMTAGTEDLEEKLKSAGAVLIGPGMGRKAQAETVFKKCIMSTSPKVIDADGLYHLHAVHAVADEGPVRSVLTPHVGEAAMLCDVHASEIEADSVGAALEIARKYRAVCVLKSASTVIATPDGKTYLTSTGCSGMAGGGMGDLLSGIITALLGQGLSPVEAAVSGVLIHGEAGRCDAAANGNVGMCATDLLPYVRLLVNGISPRN